jgi:hypothetical protein
VSSLFPLRALVPGRHQGFLGAERRLGLSHRVLNHADDDGEYRTADATTHQLAHDDFPIDSARSRRKCRNERAENLSATDASKGAGNGIPGWTQVGILHAGSSSISSDCASDELDNQIDNGA